MKTQIHNIQQKILRLAELKDIGKLKLREIGSEIGEVHPQKIKHHLQQLIKRKILRVDSLNQSISVLKPGLTSNGMLIAIPIMGSANCGEATMVAEEKIEGMLMVSPSFVKNKNIASLFAVKAVGNSLNRSKIDDLGTTIEDGDYVIVDKNKNIPKHNTYVLSVIDGSANIKKFYIDRQNKQYVLLSESSQNFAPIHIYEDDFQNYMINGTVVGVIKKPQLEKQKIKSLEV